VGCVWVYGLGIRKRGTRQVMMCMTRCKIRTREMVLTYCKKIFVSNEHCFFLKIVLVVYEICF